MQCEFYSRRTGRAYQGRTAKGCGFRTRHSSSRAYDLCVDVANSDATLGEQIRSSFEEIHKRKSEWDEAEKRILNPSVVKKTN